LLTTDGFTFEGRYFQVRDATLNPKPVQEPLPLWIGAKGEKRMMPIAAATPTCGTWVAMSRR
ncbi:MAG TPA: LLM class flavin-dependent oxidoreductase, partial [Acidimicrobiia bacterium]|nr:LLM class flavin-dependent oxidoreductase [Acidimicrobiia bacterium]